MRRVSCGLPPKVRPRVSSNDNNSRGNNNENNNNSIGESQSQGSVFQIAWFSSRLGETIAQRRHKACPKDVDSEHFATCGGRANYYNNSNNNNNKENKNNKINIKMLWQ